MDSRPAPFSYVRGMSTAGIFFYDGGRAYYLQLDAMDTELYIDIGRHINVVFCSTAGLLLCRHRCNDVNGHPIYAVLNPSIPGSERIIRSPMQPHPVGTARALVVCRDVSCRWFFHIVCAVPVEDRNYGYTVEEYSSYTCQWHYRNLIPNGVGRIRANSGVSCGRRAYWLTETTGLIVYYDVENHWIFHLNMPDCQPLQDQIVRNRSQLGVGDISGVGREELFFIAATQTQVVAYTLRHGLGIWTCDFRFLVTSCERPIPLRSRSRGLEVLFCHQQRLYICVGARDGSRNIYIFPMQFQTPVLDSADDFVPHIVNLALNPRDMH